MEKDLSSDSNHSNSGTAKIIYILYLLGLLVGLTSIVGLVIAYIYKSDAPEWLQSHYQFQIRTFWIGLLYLIVGSMLAMVLIGYLVLLFWLIWLIVRCVKGLKQLGKSAAMPNPKTWLF